MSLLLMVFGAQLIVERVSGIAKMRGGVSTTCFKRYNVVRLLGFWDQLDQGHVSLNVVSIKFSRRRIV